MKILRIVIKANNYSSKTKESECYEIVPIKESNEESSPCGESRFS